MCRDFVIHNRSSETVVGIITVWRILPIWRGWLNWKWHKLSTSKFIHHSALSPYLSFDFPRLTQRWRAKRHDQVMNWSSSGAQLQTALSLVRNRLAFRVKLLTETGEPVLLYTSLTYSANLKASTSEKHVHKSILWVIFGGLGVCEDVLHVTSSLLSCLNIDCRSYNVSNTISSCPYTH